VAEPGVVEVRLHIGTITFFIKPSMKVEREWLGHRSPLAAVVEDLRCQV
jgi:hypothetical protein